ncbi:TetR/AcrR family transcriptional regulator [Henriciella litoralis]|uniref:TetR/AcrR family transcriptional regulator n=1 Tax=Henriciella litoralis TaxID=568102 RepID=UPI00146F4D85|nr:TetR/AcrR family transcriptional regulator [Henriciella litoralis]
MAETDTETSSARLTQAERRDRSERELLEATMRVVSKHGVSAATFDVIGREAGYSRGLVTQRFGSKDGLIRALIAYLHTWQQEALGQGQLDEDDGLAELEAFIKLHCLSVGGHEESKAYYMLLSAAVADRDNTAAFADEHEVERQLIRQMIERGQQEGRIKRDVDADATALMIGCALIGIRMQKLIDPATGVEPIRKALMETLRARLALAK